MRAVKITPSVEVTEVIKSHEKRIGTLELVALGFLIWKIAKIGLRIIAEKLHNITQDI